MSNEGMTNSITDVPSAIAELLAVNKQLEQELQKTREQLKKAESVLKVSVDINVSGWETYRMANQYFKEKDKQSEE